MKKLIILGYLMCILCQLQAREITLLNKDWSIYPSYDVRKNPAREYINIPHTWNTKDVFEGMKYDRSSYVYERMLPQTAKDKRVFIRFGAVNSSAEVAINQRVVGQHYGGYTAFCFEITDFLNQEENKLTVLASNAYRTDVAPLAGDFNIYGGITRPVEFIVTEKNCISPLDFASSGVYIHQKNVNKSLAELDIESILSLDNEAENLSLKTSIIDAQGQCVASAQQKAIDGANHQAISIEHPHLWNGREQAYLYKVRVELIENERVIDMVEERLGLRTFYVDNEKGFFLNDKALDLYGVCRHEEWPDSMSLYNEAAMSADARIIYDLGATGVRFVHYPHSPYDAWVYDSLGIVVWSELNLAGPGGYGSPGYIKNEQLERNVMQNLEEMIRQNYNSPSICFWSLCNELSFKYDEPATFLRQLHEKAKAIDPQRLTTLAICYDQDKFQHITDVIGWNKYFGWYNADKSIGNFMDQAHEQARHQPIGLCEYGAAASIYQHGFEKKVSNKVHLEEYQAKVHEDNWMQMRTRPYVWCKFIWQYADNPSSIRDEGDTKGMNDKGIVTYDRKVKKDAYYFYQANWSKAPMLYIASRRYTQRTEALTAIKIYSNQSKATLYLNGKRIASAKNDGMGRIIFEDIILQDGENRIEVKAGKYLNDSCIWFLNSSKQPAEKSGELRSGSLDGAV